MTYKKSTLKVPHWHLIVRIVQLRCGGMSARPQEDSLKILEDNTRLLEKHPMILTPHSLK